MMKTSFQHNLFKLQNVNSFFQFSWSNFVFITIIVRNLQTHIWK